MQLQRFLYSISFYIHFMILRLLKKVSLEYLIMFQLINVLALCVTRYGAGSRNKIPLFWDSCFCFRFTDFVTSTANFLKNAYIATFMVPSGILRQIENTLGYFLAEIFFWKLLILIVFSCKKVKVLKILLLTW